MYYREGFPTVYEDAISDAEPFEANKIVRYAVVWSLIAYAVILRKLIEQRSRAPPLLPRSRHPAHNLPEFIPVPA